jgi:ribosomal peptide maturation radical SAM protein 1
MFDFSDLLSEGDVLIIVPPLADLEMPSFAAHLLQACAKRDGFEVRVLYTNLLLAQVIGVEAYQEITTGLLNSALIGERYFSQAAYGTYVGLERATLPHAPYQRSFRLQSASLSWESFETLSAGAGVWIRDVVDGLTPYGFPIVGCTTSFDQTSASIAFLNAIKRCQPNTLTILGGANCEGEMALGIASLKAKIDYIFSGESETSFVQFLRGWRSGRLPVEKIISGAPVEEMDELPLPDYSEYFRQFSHYMGDVTTMKPKLVYESSRGCWWGAKNHCTFCGLNGLTLTMRQKSAGKVLADLQAITQTYPETKIVMADNIMPYGYFQTLLPKLKEQRLKLDLFYEQKANLSFDKMRVLRDTGITSIQPGIEALSTLLLRRMDKGVTAAQNIALLRYARMLGISVAWNLLYGFPYDELDAYQETLRLLPLLHHLMPPKGFYQVSLDRFSPYFSDPDRYGIRNMRPLAAYADVFPPHADLERLAYHFSGEYPSAALENPGLIETIQQELKTWQARWVNAANNNQQVPQLTVNRLGKQSFLLYDTRGLADVPETQILDRDKAVMALLGGKKMSPALIDWAIKFKIGVLLDDVYVPLATCSVEIMDAFMGKNVP